MAQANFVRNSQGLLDIYTTEAKDIYSSYAYYLLL